MYELYNHQKAMLEPMKNCENTLLLAPCGSGKTLAAIYNWLQERPTGHLIYVLPTTTLLKSIKEDVTKILKNLNYKCVKLEDKSFADRNQLSIAADYGDERETTLYAYDIIFTTLDSYISRLYRCALTPKRYRDLPTARILNSTTVFDEAHMYDDYTHTLMRYTLELLREGGAHHIVMTATLNNGMIRFLGLQNGYYRISVPDKEWMNFVGNKRIKEIVEFKDKSEIADKIKEIINRNDIKKAMIVCNTVEKAQNVFKELESTNPNVLLLHSRFTPDDRDNREKRISDILKKGNGFIVATQVVEAGLDISVPSLITEIAPGDSLVQRIGRCARRRGEYGSIYILFSKSDKVLPYSNAEIDPLLEILHHTDYNHDLERKLVNCVLPPQLVGAAEAKARGIILNAFTSLSAFGDAWVNLPARDSTPIYLHFGDDKPKGPNPLDNTVRVDLRFLYGVLNTINQKLPPKAKQKELNDIFTFYEARYNEEKRKIEVEQTKAHFAWSIAVPKKGININYDETLGVVKNG